MKINSIISHLEKIDKNELIVSIPTNSKTSSSAKVVIGKDSSLQFSLDISLQHSVFGENSHPEFAVKSKKINLTALQGPSGETIHTDDSTKLVIENFFRNFIIPDIQFRKTTTANKDKTTA